MHLKVECWRHFKKKFTLIDWLAGWPAVWLNGWLVNWLAVWLIGLGVVLDSKLTFKVAQ